MRDADDPKRDFPSGISAGERPTRELDQGITARAGPGAPRMDPQLSVLAQRYEVLNELGRGGMGVVYRARDRETNEVVALKVLKPEIAADPAVLERFKSELRLARKITHKCVCRTHELLRFDSTVVISMEYIEGESLRRVLSSAGGVSLRKGLEWAGQICGALEEAHAQGVVHRDLKPENILIDRQGAAKVMDFGIARSMGAGATQAGGCLGTPAYMSPEQAEGKPADSRSDIYSLGLVLYEMFTAQPAFQAETPAAYLHKHVHETPTPPREVERLLPGFLDHAIWKCLEKNPKQRFQSASELAAALAEKPESRPSAAVDKTELPVHLTSWRKSDWFLVLAAIAGLALFFPFFNLTSPAPRSKVSFDRSVLRRIAQEYAEKLGTRVSGEGSIEASANGIEYEYVARRAGAISALELANRPLLYSQWEVRWGDGTRVVVSNTGALLGFIREFSGGTPEESLSLDDARPLAEKEIREVFDRDPAKMKLDYMASGQILNGHPANVFRWAEAGDYEGVKRFYEVWLVGRSVGATSAKDDWPESYDYDWGYFYRQLFPYFVILLFALVTGFLQRRQVQSAAPWRIGSMAAWPVLLEWYFWPSLRDQPGPNLVALLLAFAVALIVITFLASVAIERSVVRVAPERFGSILYPLDARRAAPQALGLGILRGTLLGFALLGLDSFLAWVGTRYLGWRLDSFFLMVSEIQTLGRSWATVGGVAGGFMLAACAAGPIVFLSSLGARFVSRSWAAIVIPSALTALFLPGPVICMAAIEPYHWKLILLFLECLLLTIVFVCFDALTVFWAVLTFGFCWNNYRLMVIFEPVGSLEQWIAFSLFGLSVLGSAAWAFRSSLHATYQRIKLAFE